VGFEGFINARVLGGLARAGAPTRDGFINAIESIRDLSLASTSTSLSASDHQD
jgi:hypothetical protein